MANPTELYRRLREMAQLSDLHPSPMVRGVDMSPRMVSERLRELADVSELCARLALAVAPRRG